MVKESLPIIPYKTSHMGGGLIENVNEESGHT